MQLAFATFLSRLQGFFSRLEEFFSRLQGFFSRLQGFFSRLQESISSLGQGGMNRRGGGGWGHTFGQRFGWRIPSMPNLDF